MLSCAESETAKARGQKLKQAAFARRLETLVLKAHSGSFRQANFHSGGRAGGGGGQLEFSRTFSWPAFGSPSVLHAASCLLEVACICLKRLLVRTANAVLLEKERKYHQESGALSPPLRLPPLHIRSTVSLQKLEGNSAKAFPKGVLKTCWFSRQTFWVARLKFRQRGTNQNN